MTWFLLIDSRQSETCVNIMNIEEFAENDAGRLILTYYIPNEAKSKDDSDMVY